MFSTHFYPQAFIYTPYTNIPFSVLTLTHCLLAGFISVGKSFAWLRLSQMVSPQPSEGSRAPCCMQDEYIFFSLCWTKGEDSRALSLSLIDLWNLIVNGMYVNLRLSTFDGTCKQFTPIRDCRAQGPIFPFLYHNFLWRRFSRSNIRGKQADSGGMRLSCCHPVYSTFIP